MRVEFVKSSTFISRKMASRKEWSSTQRMDSYKSYGSALRNFFNKEKKNGTFQRSERLCLPLKGNSFIDNGISYRQLYLLHCLIMHLTLKAHGIRKIVATGFRVPVPKASLPYKEAFHGLFLEPATFIFIVHWYYYMTWPYHTINAHGLWLVKFGIRNCLAIAISS